VANSQPLPVPPSQPVMVLAGRIEPAAIPSLCDRARELLESSGRFTLRCDVQSAIADRMTLNALARIALTCRRLGRRLELRGASARLEELVIFAGLIEVLPCLPDGTRRAAGSGLQPRRQSEHREEPRSVQEERDPCDPIS
jgi:ABC-type transporter Mla MlaB component